MEFTTYVRKPFTVEAVKITKENIAEIAKLVGTLKDEDTDNPYIQVDRKLVPNVPKVSVGFYMTKMGTNIRCYASHIFEAQFLEFTPEREALLANLAGDESPVASA